MTISIQAPVGHRGKNRVDDVRKVQLLLQTHSMPVGAADGVCGPRTVGAISTFQAAFLRHPDGLVAPQGLTLQRLNLISHKPTTTQAPAPQLASPAVIQKLAPAQSVASLTKLVPRQSLGPLNVGLHAVSNKIMLARLGAPRDKYSADCQPITNVKLKAQIKTASVGPFRVTGWAPAVDSLTGVMGHIKTKYPAIYTVLGSAGMLCCRFVRGSTTSISNHSWGTAIDLTINGVLDKRGNGQVQYGLALIAPIFNQHGWYWGAGFATEDGMHFEISQDLLMHLTKGQK